MNKYEAMSVEDLRKQSAEKIMGWEEDSKDRLRFRGIEFWHDPKEKDGRKILTKSGWTPDQDSNQLDLIENKLLSEEVTIDENKVPYRRTIYIAPYPDETNINWKPDWGILKSCEDKKDWSLTRLKAYCEAFEKLEQSK